MKALQIIALLQAAGLLAAGGNAPQYSAPRTAPAAWTAEAEESWNGMVLDKYSTECRITGYTADLPEELTIPETIDGLTVRWIGKDAFQDCTKLKSVTIPGTVTNFYTGCFHGCTSLESVTFQEGEQGVAFDDNPFVGTPWLTTQRQKDPLVIASRTVIEGTGCTGSVQIPDGIEAVAPGAFAENTKITDITFPESITGIGADAFRSCSKLNAVSIPGTVTTVNARAFQSCSNLKTLTIGEGTERIESYAFQDCTALKTVTLPDSLDSLGFDVFAGCSVLESLTLPRDLRSVAAGAFTDCTALKELTCLCNYTFFPGEPGDPNTNTDNGITVSNSGKYSKNFKYSGVLKGYDGSLVQQYAKRLNLSFKSLGAPPASGVCGEKLIWNFTEGTLSIEGDGEMKQYNGLQAINGEFIDQSYLSVPPWYMFRDQIKQVVVAPYVEKISSGALADMTAMESVIFLNPNCQIPFGKRTISNSTDANGEYVFSGTISGYTDSTAQKYAEYYKINFQPLDEQSSTTTSAVMTTGTTTETMTTTPATPLKGDVSGDGEVNTADAVLLARFVGEDTALTDTQVSDILKHEPDYDGDGLVTIFDVTALLRKTGEK